LTSVFAVSAADVVIGATAANNAADTNAAPNQNFLSLIFTLYPPVTVSPRLTRMRAAGVDMHQGFGICKAL
jgi:hypothetical protein